MLAMIETLDSKSVIADLKTSVAPNASGKGDIMDHNVLYRAKSLASSIK